MAIKCDKHWYALRVTYQREMKVKYDLDSKRIENFIPMKYTFHNRGERRVKVLTPVIHNLIFVHTSEEELIRYKERSELPIRYIIDKVSKKPIVIPDKQMNNFIGVAGSYDEQLIYLESNPQNWEKGQHVRITGGVFKGYEGRFVRVKNDRRVVVEIPGFIAVATGFIHPSLLEPINEE